MFALLLWRSPEPETVSRSCPRPSSKPPTCAPPPASPGCNHLVSVPARALPPAAGYIAVPASLLSRMVRCNKPGCRFCEKGQGQGHGPIWILSVSLGNRQVRQIPIPNELKKEVEESLRAFAQMQKVLKQIAQVNLELFKERKRQRP